MSCSRELKELIASTENAKDSDFKDGFLTGVKEALEIVEAHEEEE